MKHRSRRKSACGSKELDPPFPFPPGASRGGAGSPHAAHAARQPTTLARIDAAAPPARGISKRFAEIPLARSPCQTARERQAVLGSKLPRIQIKRLARAGVGRV